MTAFFMNFSRASTIRTLLPVPSTPHAPALSTSCRTFAWPDWTHWRRPGAGIEEITASGKSCGSHRTGCNLPVASSGCPNPSRTAISMTTLKSSPIGTMRIKKTLKRCLYELPATYGLDSSSGSCNVVWRKFLQSDGIPIFTFLDNDDAIITNNNDRSLIRSVILTLTVEEPPAAEIRWRALTPPVCDCATSVCEST